MSYAGSASSEAARRRHAEQQRILYQRGQQGGAFERVAPTKGESRRWERSGRFQKRVLTCNTLRHAFDNSAEFLEALANMQCLYMQLTLWPICQQMHSESLPLRAAEQRMQRAAEIS